VSRFAAGMSYFAAKDMVHRDLTAHNILVSENKVCKVAGFGMARYVEEGFPDVSGLHQIPVKWTAPEVMLSDPEVGRSGDKAVPTSWLSSSSTHLLSDDAVLASG
jgi:serine/threonine protein kinase